MAPPLRFSALLAAVKIKQFIESMFELLFLADKIYPFHLFRATTLKQFLEEKSGLQLLTTDLLLTLIS